MSAGTTGRLGQPMLPDFGTIRPGSLKLFPFRKLWANGPVLLTAASLFWSGNFVVARAVQDEITPTELSFWRWLVALGVLAGFALQHLRQDIGRLRQNWVQVVVLAALGISAMNTLIYRGLETTTVVNALLLQSTAPLLVLSCMAVLYREVPRLRQILAIAVSLVGVLAIASRGGLTTLWRGAGVGSGDLLVVAGTLCYAAYTTMLRRRPAVHATSLLAACIAAGVVLLLPFVIAQHVFSGLAQPSGRLAGAVTYLAAFPSVLAFLCLNRGVELLGAGRAGQYLHLVPVFGSILAIMFLGERLYAYHVVGAGLIGGGLLIARDAAPGWLSRRWQRVRLYAERVEERRLLQCLDAVSVRDLGSGRIDEEAHKPFWRE